MRNLWFVTSLGEGYGKILCETDSLQALRLIIIVQELLYHIHASIVEDIRALVARDWQVRFMLIWREGNGCADFLAKMGSEDLISLRIWDKPLDGVRRLLAEDREGTVYVRVYDKN